MEDGKEFETADKPKSKEFDFAKYGDIKIDSGGSKPVFERVSEAVVLSAVVKIDEAPKETLSKDGKAQRFYPIFLACEFSYKDAKTGEERQTYENYGGGRLYVSDEKQTERLWVGPDSQLGMLVKVLSDNFDFKGTLKEVPKFLIGQKVGVKTEVITVSGTDYQKTVVKAIYK